MTTRRSQQPRLSRRDLLKTVAAVAAWSGAGSLAWAEDVPPEPDNLDEPTSWQEGDPQPTEMQVPATEPEQTSSEAPPSQPMADERPPQPSQDSVWVSGYWWWTNGQYVWVPGYWAVPPQPQYVYIPGYWTYTGGTWVYVRGGWGMPNTTTVVHYAQPRPALAAFVITAPRRIRRRHYRWAHYHHRKYWDARYEERKDRVDDRYEERKDRVDDRYEDYRTLDAPTLIETGCRVFGSRRLGAIDPHVGVHTLSGNGAAVPPVPLHNCS